MQRYTIFFITVSALNVSGGFSAHHQELKKLYNILYYCQCSKCFRRVFRPSSGAKKTLYNILYYCQCSKRFRRVFRPTSGAQKLYTQHPVAASKLDIYRMLCVQFELLMMGGKPLLKHLEH